MEAAAIGVIMFLVILLLSLILFIFVLVTTLVWVTYVKSYRKGFCLRYFSVKNLIKAYKYSWRIGKLNKRDDPFGTYNNIVSSGAPYEMTHTWKNTPKLDSERIEGL